MSVFRTIDLWWDDTTHPMTPSVDLLRRIKSKGINNLALAQSCLRGGADPSELAVVHSMFLKAAGVIVDEDKSYLFLTSGETDRVVEFQLAYVGAVLPAIDLGKKPEAPADPAGVAAMPKKVTKPKKVKKAKPRT